LNKCAAETDLRLKRLYDAIESGVADLTDLALKRSGLPGSRRSAIPPWPMPSEGVTDVLSWQAITPQMVRKFASTARARMRIAGGGYRRDHLRALTQRVEVADKEVRIIGSKSDLLRTLAASLGVGPAAPGVRSSVLKWRTRRESNSRPAFRGQNCRSRNSISGA
jgi:site-specific DNA recombinase